MNPAQTANVSFLLLFLAYVAQFLFISPRLRRGIRGSSRWKSPSELWFFIALSLLTPILIGVLPELLVEVIGVHLAADAKPGPALPFTVLDVGVRFMIAYLITIVTLELALQIQAFQQRKDNPWIGFLITNLSFDIISVLVFQMVQAILHSSSLPAPGPSVSIFFIMCAAPTILTGVIVVCGSYSALTTGD
jgi:hypothetical protein